MKCLKCGAENGEGINFCTQCGSKLEQEIVNNIDNNEQIINNDMNNNPTNFSVGFDNCFSTQNNNSNNFNTQKQKKGHTGLILIIILLIIAAIVAFFLFFKKTDKDNTDNSNNSTNSTENQNNNSNNTNTTNNNNSNNNTPNNNNSNTTANNNNDSTVKFDNYKVKATMVMSISGIDVTTILSGTIDELNQKAYLKMDMNSMGMVISTETYTDYKTGYSYIKDPFSDDWTKQNGGTQLVDLNGLSKQLKEMNNVTKIDDNHYKVQITADEIQGLLSTTDTDASVITGGIVADVYTENGYITRIYYDFSEMTDSFDTFTLDMTIYDYDKAGTVEIPSDIVESATEY